MREYRHPFEPFYNMNSKFLILGSFPSRLSKENGFYYGNLNNAFWKILQEVFKNPKLQGNEAKKTFLIQHKIALYDIVLSYEGEVWASQDKDLFGQANIQYTTLRLQEIFCQLPEIRVFATSREVEKRFLRLGLNQSITYLPSPSGSCRISFQEKVRQYQEALNPKRNKTIVVGRVN